MTNDTAPHVISLETITSVLSIVVRHFRHLRKGSLPLLSPPLLLNQFSFKQHTVVLLQNELPGSYSIPLCYGLPRVCRTGLFG